MALRRCGPVEPLQPGELEAAAAEVKRRDAQRGPSHGPFQTEEEYFDHILEKIGDNPATSVDFGSDEKMGRFYKHWSQKRLAGEVSR